MSTRPIPVIQPVDDISYADIPVASVSLDGTDSTASDGATSIVEWLWTLHSKPPNSTADLVNPTTATPQLINVDQPGSYLISLQVIDNSGRSSHSGIEPIQSTTVPYGFSFPALSSMIAVRALTVNGLVKAAYGERQWLARGLWELVDRVDDHSSQLNTVPTNGQIYADDIYEFTTDHGITIHHDVTFEPDVDLTIPTGVIYANRIEATNNTAYVSLGQSGGDILISAQDDLLATAPSATVLTTENAVFWNRSVADGTDVLVLKTGLTSDARPAGSRILLAPEAYTRSERPVIAPGLVLSETDVIAQVSVTTNPSDPFYLLNSMSFSRHNVGAEVSYDVVIRGSILKAGSLSLTGNLLLSLETNFGLVELGSFSTNTVINTTSRYYMRIRVSLRLLTENQWVLAGKYERSDLVDTAGPSKLEATALSSWTETSFTLAQGSTLPEHLTFNLYVDRGTHGSTISGHATGTLHIGHDQDVI
jgi:hypothetical protein